MTQTVDEGDANARDTSLIPDALQTAVKKYRSSCCSTLYIKGSDQQLNELQNFLETFDFHIVVIGDTSFDILGRIDKKVVVLPIQKIQITIHQITNKENHTTTGSLYLYHQKRSYSQYSDFTSPLLQLIFVPAESPFTSTTAI